MATSSSSTPGARKPASGSAGARKPAAERPPARATTRKAVGGAFIGFDHHLDPAEDAGRSRPRRSPSAPCWCPSARACSPATTSSRRSRASRRSTAPVRAFERELKRYERRGATARNRFERQVRKTRTRFERELRQRRTRVERTVKQNRRRLEREVRSVRRDLERQSGDRRSSVREARLRRAGAAQLSCLTTSPAGARGERRDGTGSPAS